MLIVSGYAGYGKGLGTLGPWTPISKDDKDSSQVRWSLNLRSSSGLISNTNSTQQMQFANDSCWYMERLHILGETPTLSCLYWLQHGLRADPGSAGPSHRQGVSEGQRKMVQEQARSLGCEQIWWNMVNQNSQPKKHVDCLTVKSPDFDCSIQTSHFSPWSLRTNLGMEAEAMADSTVLCSKESWTNGLLQVEHRC